jgi:hypothetical protein
MDTLYFDGGGGGGNSDMVIKIYTLKAKTMMYKRKKKIRKLVKN